MKDPARLRSLAVVLLLVTTMGSGCASDGDPDVTTRGAETPTTPPLDTAPADGLAASLDADLARVDALLEQLGAELSAAAPGHERELVE